VLQVRDLLKVEWVQGDPARGLDSVYLSDDDYQRVKASVKAELSVQPDGECRGACEKGSWCPWSFRQVITQCFRCNPVLCATLSCV